jgi:hypothetical protein
MATIGNTYLTLADTMRRENKDHQIATIIEMLAQINPILQDAITVECNDGTRHKTTVRTGLPRAIWRKLYQGVPVSKSTTAQVYDTTGMLEAWSQVDAAIIDNHPDKAAIRLSESIPFIETMNQEMATGLFYNDTATAPEKFIGLAPRFNSSTASNGSQVIKGGGAGSDNTSIWFIVWGENTCHMLYPNGSMAGLQREDKGKDVAADADGNPYDVYREKFCWNVGLSVRDWRYVSRICNIDVSELKSDASTGAKLLELMIDGYYALRQRRVMNGKAAIYCNSTIKKFLHKQAHNKTNVDLSLREVAGEELMSFQGIPIRECDAIVNTEETVS